MIAWKDGDGYVAVTASAGPAYCFADLTRSILVTNEYALQVDRAQATDGKQHTFDFNYHNYGKQTLQLQTSPYNNLPHANGYMHLEQAQRGETSDNIITRFDNQGTTMSLKISGGTPTEVFEGVAPGPHAAIKVPFLIARRKGTKAEFISLFVPSKGDPSQISARPGKEGVILVSGPGWQDTVQLGETIQYQRTNTSATAEVIPLSRNGVLSRSAIRVQLNRGIKKNQRPQPVHQTVSRAGRRLYP